MSFTPNMTPKEIAELDKERGKKFYDEEDHFEPNNLPVEKKPWQVKTPVNKSGEKEMSGTKILKSFVRSYDPDPDAEKISKPLPEKKKREGESEFQHKIRQWTDEVKERPGRFPGGQKQAIAIAAEQSGKAKKGVEGLFGKAETEVEVEGDEVEIEGAKEVEIETKKALSTRSFYIPRPAGIYDPFNIMRSATTPTTRGHSKLIGPEGVAPLVGDTFKDAEEDAYVRSKQVTYKSCGFHGVAHRADAGCMMCRSSMSKSTACKACGKDMQKTKGGGMSCKDCMSCE